MTTDTVRDTDLLDPARLQDMNKVGAALIRSAHEHIGLLSSLCTELQRLMNEANEREMRVGVQRPDEAPPSVLN